MILLLLISFGYLNVILRFWTVNVNIPFWIKVVMNIFITIGYLSLILKLWMLAGYEVTLIINEVF